MNSVVTSKEAILLAFRTIAAGQRLSALSMRTVAKGCGIALGTLYNYFPDKDTLLLATVESVWKDIFHRSNPCGAPLPFPDYVADLFRGILDGAVKYPIFLTAHSLAIAGSKKGEAKNAITNFHYIPTKALSMGFTEFLLLPYNELLKKLHHLYPISSLFPVTSQKSAPKI